MKKYLIPIFAFFLTACEDEIAPPLLEGRWQLFEVLADPGDGSGTFMPIASEEEIKLFADLSFNSTESLCRQFRSDPSVAGSGTYDTAQMVFIPDNCVFNDSQISYNFELDQNGHLTIYFPCIEPCANKYKKMGALTGSD